MEIIKDYMPEMKYHTSIRNDDDKHGVILSFLSKYPIKKEQNLEIPSKSNAAGAIWVDINGKQLLVVNCHLETQSLSLSEKEGFSRLVHGVANDARAYAKATVTVKNTKNVNIETLVFDISEQGLKRLAPITASVGTVATQANGDNTVSWSGEATEVTFTVGDKANYGSDGAEKAGQLCFNDIKVTEGGQGQSSFGATLAEANVAATATEATVNVTGNVAWTASVTSGATVDPASGTGEGAVTVTFPANTDTENSKTYTVTLTTTADVPTKTIQLVITQAKAGGAVTDVLNQKFTGISGSSYTDFSGKTGASGAVYAGQCAGSNSSIQLRSKNSNCGIVTTDTGGKAKKVTVTWESHTMEGRTLNIYGKNTAYSSASDLYDDAKQGTLLGSVTYGTSTEVTISGDYTYIGFRSAADAMYLSEIKIVWE